MEVLEQLKNTPLSSSQLAELTGCPVYIYSDLAEMESLDQCFQTLGNLDFPENQAFVVLYLTSPHYGHFCCVLKTYINSEPIIEFFDAYGYKPDFQLDFNTDENNEELRQDGKILSALMIESTYELSYNNFDFQGKESTVQTCGYHCANRIKFAEYTLLEYRELMETLKKMTGLDDNEVIMISLATI